MKVIGMRIITKLKLFSSLLVILIAVTLFVVYGNTKVDTGSRTGESQSGPHPSPVAAEAVQPFTLGWSLSDLGLDQNLDLREGPVDIPLELRIPSLQVSAPMVGVGITSENVMDAPKGSADNPVWQKVFWYRGSGIPGDLSTTTLAGHVDDALGRPAAFARLKELRAGDLIVVHDTRSGLDINFKVMKAETYSAQQSVDPEALTEIYGYGPVSGKGPQPSSDGLSHLTLITCTGEYVNGSYNHRLVVYATRSS